MCGGPRATGWPSGEEVALASAPAGDPDAAEPVSFEIVFEDEQLLVVDKPAGVVVHPAPGHRGATLAEALWRRRRRAGPIRSGPGSCTGSTATPRG